MKKGFAFILPFLLLSCLGDDASVREAPDDLLSQEELIPLIIDLQILESHYQRLYQRPNLYKDALDSASSFIFAAHGIPEEQFESSYDYYALDQDALFAIYESALDSINLRVSPTSVNETE